MVFLLGRDCVGIRVDVSRFMRIFLIGLVRVDSGLELNDSGGNGERWLNLEYIFNIVFIGFKDDLMWGYGKRRIKKEL